MENQDVEGQNRAQVETPLPDVSLHQKFVEAAHAPFFPKNNLDSLHIWWKKSSETDTLTGRFKAGLEGDIPEPEMRDATLILEQRLKFIETAKKGIVNFVKAEKPKWGWTKPIFKAIEGYEEALPVDQQVTALCEALSETRDEWGDEMTARRKVAQWAWEELFNACTYANLHYQADTGQVISTVDDIETEKDELTVALRRDLWDEKKIAEQRKIYRSWKAMIDDYYDEETADSLKLVWDSIRGKAGKSTSAVDILQAAEQVLRDLDWEGAFEYEFEDLEEEE